MEVNTAVVHDSSPGPNRSKVIVPVGATPFDRVAVSVTGFPTSTGPEATVERPGSTASTVTKSIPRPTALVVTSCRTRPSTSAAEAVCTPRLTATSMVGTLRTSKENCIVQLSSRPNVDKATLLDGVNVTIPVASGALMAKVSP